MTEFKWLNFAGFLNECTYGLDHENCPYKKYRGMDQYQRLEQLIKFDAEDAEQMMRSCNQVRSDCSPLIYEQPSKSWSLEVAI